MLFGVVVLGGVRRVVVVPLCDVIIQLVIPNTGDGLLASVGHPKLRYPLNLAYAVCRGVTLLVLLAAKSHILFNNVSKNNVSKWFGV